MLSISSCVKKENFVPEMCSTMIMAADTYIISELRLHGVPGLKLSILKVR